MRIGWGVGDEEGMGKARVIISILVSFQAAWILRRRIEDWVRASKKKKKKGNHRIFRSLLLLPLLDWLVPKIHICA